MSTHDLTYAIVVPETAAIGESGFATARAAIEAKHGVSPVEVFLDGVKSTGVIHAGDLQFDLAACGLRLISFGATSDGATPIPSTTAPASETPIADSIATTPVQTPVASTTTTTTTD